jgi:hypothetical protein
MQKSESLVKVYEAIPSVSASPRFNKIYKSIVLQLAFLLHAPLPSELEQCTCNGDNQDLSVYSWSHQRSHETTGCWYRATLRILYVVSRPQQSIVCDLFNKLGYFERTESEIRSNKTSVCDGDGWHILRPTLLCSLNFNENVLLLQKLSATYNHKYIISLT